MTDLQAMLEKQQAKYRDQAKSMLIGAAVMWVIVLALTWGAVFLFAVVISEDGQDRGWWPWIAVGCVFLLLAFLVLPFMGGWDIDPEPEEPSLLMEIVPMGKQAYAGAFVGGLFMMIPKMTAEGIRGLRQSRGIDPAHFSAADQIVRQLNSLNDWVPAATYQNHLVLVAELVRLDILRVKEVHHVPHVRLNPSLMD